MTTSITISDWRLSRALNAAADLDDDALESTSAVTVALNLEEGESAEVPTDIMLIPAGPLIRGRDGRRWSMDDPQAVILATQARGVDIPIDWNHAIEHQAPRGGQSPAAGWIGLSTLRVRDGAIWGTAAWNAAGSDSVAAREYRYLSPVFYYRGETLEVHSLVSISLVNSPNLHIPALNNRGHKESDRMDPELLRLLGLDEKAGNAAAIAAINALQTQVSDVKRELETARNAAPPADQYVPMAQYQHVLDRATTAETALTAQRESDLESAINTAVEAAIEAGKIAPASREFYVSSCQQEGGLERFKQFIESAPKVIADESGLGGKETPDTAINHTLSPEDKAICQTMGLDETEYLKTKQELAAVGH